MHILVCVDDKGGMLFHGRRQSRDRAVCQDILDTAGDGRIWMTPYSQTLFQQMDTGAVILTDPAPQERAGTGEWCFLEEQCPDFQDECLESLTLYHWNRVYPSELRLKFLPGESGWHLVQMSEFHGHSHEKITKEVYVR